MHATPNQEKENWAIITHQAHQFSSVQLLNLVWLFATPWTAACQVSLSITNSQSLLKLMLLSWWCHPFIPFSSSRLSFPASGSLQISEFFELKWVTALTRRTFVGKIMSLLFNMPSRLVITFLPRSSSVQFSSVAQSCPTLCDPKNRSTPGLPFNHQLPEFTQTHAHRVGDAIQPSHPLLSPSPHAPNPSQHQGLFQRGNS